MPEMKALDTLVLGTITCDIALKEMSRSDIHEAIEYVMGHPVWSHELSIYADKTKELILEQYPQFAIQEGEEYEAFAERLIQNFGEKTTIERGTLHRERSPMETLNDIAGDKPVIVVVPPEKDNGPTIDL